MTAPRFFNITAAQAMREASVAAQFPVRPLPTTKPEPSTPLPANATLREAMEGLASKREVAGQINPYADVILWAKVREVLNAHDVKQADQPAEPSTPASGPVPREAMLVQALCDICNMHFDPWTQGARAKELAEGALNRLPFVEFDEKNRAAIAARHATSSSGEVADRICNDVAELPDRNSPEDWPEAMLVTHEELRQIVVDALRLPGDQA